ncbi:helix-turn-helix domain-containing protein [Streptomyces niveus]
MGRREKEITTSNTALRELAEWLRAQRVWVGLTYRELAERSGVHATTLQRAASGDSVPQLMPVLAYARGCDAQPEDARRLWCRARREQARAGTSHSPVPSPALIRDFADLSAALRDLYEKAGVPSLRTMETRAGGFGSLPRSSAHRIVNKQTVPHNLDQFRAYLRACEVPAREWKAWEDAWSRAWRLEKQDDAGLTEAMTWTIRVEKDLPRYRPLAPRQRADAEQARMLPMQKSLRERAVERSRLVAASGQTVLAGWPDDTAAGCLF